MIAPAFALFLAAAAQADPLTTQLRARDQALLDAVAPGDKPVWDTALTADAVYIDENGEIMDRAAFLKQLNPLPKGVSGTITIVDYRLTRHGDTAFVIHRDDEREHYHGVELRAEYLDSEVWRREGGAWKLASVHAYVVNRDPPPIPLTAAQLNAYAGRYRAGTDLVTVIARDGDHLVAGREGAAGKPVAVEAVDVLFTPGQPRSRKIFQRDTAGRVTGYLDRREGVDIPWVKDR